MRLDAGVSLQCCYNILAAAAIVFDGPTAAGKTAAPFSVWFRAEPGQPRRKDMRPDKLDRLIGSDYDETWMSKTAVVVTSKATGGGGGGGGGGGVNASGGGTAVTAADNVQFPERLPAQYQEMMRTWLARRGSCPVEFAWTDLGKSFWPRWIRNGRCGRPDTASCSWPPGMSCTPSSVRVLNLLRWHCWLKNRKSKRKKQQRKLAAMSAANNTTPTDRRRGRETGNGRVGKKKKNDDKFRCLWIKVPYPVTEDCTCSCKKFDD